MTHIRDYYEKDVYHIGEHYYTANVPIRSHFADSVRKSCMHSAFTFEDINGWFGDLQ